MMFSARFIEVIQMSKKDSGIKKLDHKHIPEKVWEVILSNLGTSKKEDFHKFCKINYDIICSTREDEWNRYVRTDPPSSELAEKIIDQVTTLDMLIFVILVSRRANPKLRYETKPYSEYGSDVAYYLLRYFYSPHEYKVISYYLPTIERKYIREIVLDYIITTDEMELNKTLILKYNLEEDIALQLASYDLPQYKVNYYFDENLVNIKTPALLSLAAIENGALFFLINLSKEHTEVVKTLIEYNGVENFYNTLKMREDFELHQSEFKEWLEKLFETTLD